MYESNLMKLDETRQCQRRDYGTENITRSRG